MNKDQIHGKASQISGKLKETWAKLTDDDVALYEGQRDIFLGVLQENYGLAKEAAEEKLRSIEKEYQASKRAA